MPGTGKQLLQKSPKMKINVNGFDDTLKIVLSIFVETFMKLFYIMDLLKIFRMQEPVPKDLLSKNPEVGKYREVVQEKDTLLRNCKARIRELEQQVADLEAKTEVGEGQASAQSNNLLIKEYESFYKQIMSESEEIVEQKNQMEAKLREMEIFCRDLMEKYDKAKKVIEQYEKTQENITNQMEEYEEIINSLTEEYNRLKEYTQKKLGETESKSSFKQQGKLKQLLMKNQMGRECCKSMFEPLPGLDK